MPVLEYIQQTNQLSTFLYNVLFRMTFAATCRFGLGNKGRMPRVKRGRNISKRMSSLFPNLQNSSTSVSPFIPIRSAGGHIRERAVPSSPIRLFDSTFLEQTNVYLKSQSSLDDHLSILWDISFDNTRKSQLNRRLETSFMYSRTYTAKEENYETVFQEEYVSGSFIPDIFYERPKAPTISAFSMKAVKTTDCEFCTSYSSICVCPKYIFSSPSEQSFAQAASNSLLEPIEEYQEPLLPLANDKQNEEGFFVTLKFGDNSFLKVLELSGSGPVYKLLAFQKLRTLERMKSSGRYSFDEYPERAPLPKYKQFAPRQSLSDISHHLNLDLFCPQLIKDLVDIVLDMFVTLHSPGFPNASIFEEMTSLEFRLCIQNLLPFIRIYIPFMTYNTLNIIVRSGYDRKRLAFKKRQKRKDIRSSNVIKKE